MHYYSAVKIYTFFDFVVIVQSSFIQFFNFSGTFLASEYLFSAPRGLFILVVFSRFRVSAQRLEDSCRTPRGLFILVVFPRFRVSAQRLEDSCKTPLRTLYFSGTSPAFEYLCSTLEDST